MVQTAPAFDNIESAHAYVGLMCEALDEAAQMIGQEMSAPSALSDGRHLDALRLVDYKLHILREHLVVSRRLLGDLRTLRRYLLHERTAELDIDSEYVSVAVAPGKKILAMAIANEVG
jgi:hypothetical protein